MQLLQNVYALRSLNRNLRKVVRQIFHRAIELSRVVTHPVEIFLARTRIDHQQIFIFAEPVHDHIINERPLRIEQSRILRLAHSQTRGVVHRDMLHCGQRLRACKADVAHVADVEDANAGAHRHVLVDDSAAHRRRIFDRHVPAVEVDHLCPHLAMDSIQSGLADGWRGTGWHRFNRRQSKPRGTWADPRKS